MREESPRSRSVPSSFVLLIRLDRLHTHLTKKRNIAKEKNHLWETHAAVTLFNSHLCSSRSSCCSCVAAFFLFIAQSPLRLRHIRHEALWPLLLSSTMAGSALDTTHFSLCRVDREQLPTQDENSPSSCHSPMSIKHCHSNGVITCSKNSNLDHENHNLISSPISTFNSIAMSEDYSCGLFSFYPKWLQSFANKQTFLFIFCLTSVLQGMYYTYFVSVLTTIEKLYQIQSKTTGIVMSATEIGQIGGALFLTYYGGQGHRPKWIAAGMIVFAIASILCSTPHFLFGGQSILSYQNPSVSSLSSSNPLLSNASDYSRSLCVNFSSTHPSTFSFSTNGGDRSPLSHDRSQSLSSPSATTKCDDPDLLTAQSKVTSWVLTIFFSSLFLIGIGSTAVNTLGIPYIDDNVAPKESPLYFG